jgi:hypothetical protein
MPKEECVNLTWENLENFYRQNGLICNFNYWNFKKGKLISLFHGCCLKDKRTWDIKEWKEPILNLKIKIEYKELTPTIQTIIQYPNGDLAMKYLKEQDIKLTNLLREV